MKKTVWILLSFVLLSPSLYAQATPGGEAVTQPMDSAATVESPKSVFPIGEEIKILRAERKHKMPYLDSGYINETINRKTIESKAAFSQEEAQTLSGVIGRAVEVYTPAKASKERIDLARRRILVAARELLPGTDFNFELRHGALSGSGFRGSDYHLNFKLPLFRGGILWNTFLKEKAEYRAAKKEYEGILNELVDEVAKAYFEFNRAREVSEDKKRAAEEARKQQGISKEKYDRSLISEIEYLNVESMAGQMQYDVETAQQEFELAKLELQRYLNLDIGDNINVAPLYNVEELIKRADIKAPKGADNYQGKPFLAQSLDEFIDLAYQNRPEL